MVYFVGGGRAGDAAFERGDSDAGVGIGVQHTDHQGRDTRVAPVAQIGPPRPAQAMLPIPVFVMGYRCLPDSIADLCSYPF